MRLFLSAVILNAIALPLQAQPTIAPADPKTPAEERASFTLPAGFEAQLVASEPDIGKPIQMAFDARGRLWVTTSRLYPFAAEKGKGTDKLFILADFGVDGKARKVTTFADNLNIPIGIQPLPDCNSCLVSSAGSILKLTDTDGDGKADKTEELFTGFGYKDTHGMVNSFTLMPDGWVYVCHGYANESTVKGKDGHEIKVQSGNVLRIRPDGSRIEVFTHGQVNPFGIAVDPDFNLYTADCHSKPITQLIRGAYYDSFGKPHDGLGFAPHVTQHQHGSTALCGLVYYEADQFPEKYRGCMFLGNVVTSRVNFDRLEWHGSTPVAKELPDFMVSKDSWFRPTDLKLGPDGAIYVADFYNKIIGHYEVDLKHPARDKDRGRVWRIVWKGEDGKAKPPAMPFTDLTKENLDQVDKLLGHPNLTVRLLATEELIRRAADRDREKVIESGKADASDVYLAHRKWVDYRSGGAQLKRDDRKEQGPLMTVHEVKVETARLERWRETTHKLKLEEVVTIQNLTKLKPAVARAVIDRMTVDPKPANVVPLVELLKVVPEDDTHLRHAARIALRNSLQIEGWAADLPKEFKEDFASQSIISQVMIGIPTKAAAGFLWDYVNYNDAPKTLLIPCVQHIARYGEVGIRSELFEFLFYRHIRFKKELNFQDITQLVESVFRGMQAGGHKLNVSQVGLIIDFIKKNQELVAKNPTAAKCLGDVIASAEQVTPPMLEDLTWIYHKREFSDELRKAATEAISRLEPKQAQKILSEGLNDPTESAAFRERTLIALSSVPTREARGEVKVALKGQPYRVAIAVSLNFASSRVGGEDLLEAVRAGFIPARVLQEKAVLDRLRGSNLPDLDKQLTELTRGLPAADQKLAELLKLRATQFTSAKPNLEAGAKLYTKHCAACHQIGGQGGKVGPQLDGVGVRGPERLLEDMLDPNRNVDVPFRSRVLTLHDGRTFTGLMLRIEGQSLVMADSEGKEYRVASADIDKNRQTNLSPMPANFGEVLPADDLFHLLGYLLDQKPKAPPKK